MKRKKDLKRLHTYIVILKLERPSDTVLSVKELKDLVRGEHMRAGVGASSL